MRRMYRFLAGLTLLATACGDGREPDSGDPEKIPGVFTPATKPSALRLRLDALVYDAGQAVKATLDFADLTAPANVRQVVLSSADSGDVEVLELAAGAEPGVFTSTSSVQVVTASGVVTPNDGNFALAPGKMFYALYFIDRQSWSSDSVQEDLVFDFAFLAGGGAGSTPTRVEPLLAMTGDELAPALGGKSIGTLLSDGGFPVQVATHELILYPRDSAELARFIADTGGEVLDAQKQDDRTAYLVAVDPALAPTDTLPALRSLFSEQGELLASNRDALGIYALTLQYQLEGYAVSVNPRLQWQGAPALAAPESTDVTHSMRMVPARTLSGPCIPNDPARPCVENVPALWAFLSLWDKDVERINVGVLDMGFAPNLDFRPPNSGARVECDMRLRPGGHVCGPGTALGTPTVGNSLFGGRSWHGTGVVTTLGGVVNNGFGAAGTGGQVAVPMLYKYDLASYAFEMGTGIRQAVGDGAGCINISAGYPCNILTNVGPDFDICSVGGRVGICAIVTAGAHLAAAAVCAATAWIPIGGAIACGVAITGAITASAACVSTLALGDLRGPISSAVAAATRAGVPVVSIAGNAISRDTLPPVIRDYVNTTNRRTESWGIVPAMLPNVITVAAANENLDNAHFFGDAVEVWAPIQSRYRAPENVDDPASPLANQLIGGTSAAAPFVAGVIAAMQAVNPSLNPNNLLLTPLERSTVVARTTAFLTDSANSFSNRRLVDLGFSDQPVERRKLINPLAVIQAAAVGVPDLAAMGYDRSLNFGELLSPDDTSAQARTLIFGSTATGTILTLPASGLATATADQDWYRFAMPAAAGRVFEARVLLTQPPRDRVYAQSSAFRVVSIGGGPEETITYRALAAAGSEIRFPVLGTAGADNVYKILAETPQMARPRVAITAPAVGATLCEGRSITFSADVSYPDYPALTVASGDIRWTDNGTALGTGATLSRTLTAGTHTVVATAFNDATLSDTRDYTVQACVGTPPTVVITSPANNPTPGPDLEVYADADSAARLTLVAAVTDPDSTLADSAVVWTTNKGDVQPGDPTTGTQTLGTGRSLPVTLFTTCTSYFGTVDHTVTVTVTDGESTAVDVRIIRVITLC